MDNNTLLRLQQLTRESPTVYAVEINCDGEVTVDAIWDTKAAAEIHRDWHNNMKGNGRGYYGKARVVTMKIRSEAVAREFYHSAQNRGVLWISTNAIGWSGHWQTSGASASCSTTNHASVCCAVPS